MSTKKNIFKTNPPSLDQARLITGESVGDLKRQATRLKKEHKITHQDALNRTVEKKGLPFPSWQSMIQRLSSLFSIGKGKAELPLSKKTFFTGMIERDNLAINHWKSLLNEDPDVNHWFINLKGDSFVYAAFQSLLTQHHMPPAKLFNITTPDLSHLLLATDETIGLLVSCIFPKKADQDKAHSYLRSYDWQELSSPDGEIFVDDEVFHALKKSFRSGLMYLVTQCSDRGEPISSLRMFAGLASNIVLLNHTKGYNSDSIECFTSLLRLIKAQQEKTGIRTRFVLTGMRGDEDIPLDIKEWLLHSPDVEWVMSVDFPMETSNSGPGSISCSEEAVLCAEMAYLGRSHEFTAKELPNSLTGSFFALYHDLYSEPMARAVRDGLTLVLSHGGVVPGQYKKIKGSPLSLGGRIPPLFFPSGEPLQSK